MTVDEPSEFGLRVSPTARSVAMTEAEWLTGNILLPLLRIVLGTDQYRRLRLLACACARQCGADLVSDSARLAIDASEQYADRLISRYDLKQSQNRVWALLAEPGWTPAGRELIRRAAWAADHRPKTALDHIAFPAPGEGRGEVHQVATRRCALVRDIFGNPFRPVAFEAAWRTSTAVALARQMYDAREFSAMPILADALEDAGCDSAEVLGHCRGPGPHVRGCWAVDLVLGKS
jgi:hypothetical protein